MMLWLGIFYLPFLLVYALIARQRGGLGNPDGLFVCFNTVALVGTLLVVDGDLPIERHYAYIVFGCTALYCLISSVLRYSVGLRARPRIRASRLRPTAMSVTLVALYLFAASVCLGYYLAIGHVTFLESIDAARSGGSYDAATARLNSYAGSKYFFPGYVNQFKNAILPALTLAMVHSWWTRKIPGRTLLSLGALAFMAVMVAGTGQRAPLVIVFLIAVLAGWQTRYLNAVRTVAALTIGFATFAVMTLGLQRNADQLGAATGAAARLKVFAEALWSRVVLENPTSGLAAFHYTQPLPTAWGEEWLTDISGVLPGSRGSDLANRVFEMLYGTDRGTAPPSLWGGMYYNFGAAGSVAIVAVIALVYVWITRRFFIIEPDPEGPREMSMLHVVALCGMAVSAGAWVAGSPLTVLNQGFFAYVFLVWFAKKESAQQFAKSPAGRSTMKDSRNEIQHHQRSTQRRAVSRRDDRVRDSAKLRALGTPDSR